MTPEENLQTLQLMQDAMSRYAKPPAEAIDKSGKMKGNWVITGVDSATPNADGTLGRWEYRPGHALAWALAGIAAVALPTVLPMILGPGGAGAASSAVAGTTAMTSGAAGTLPAAGFIGGSSAVPTVAGASLAGGASTVAAASSVSPWLRYGLPMAADAAKGYLANKNARQARNQEIAYGESNQDPFRGVMHQAQDVASLEHMAQGPRTFAPPATSPYARYINPNNAPPPLSDTYRTGVANAQQLVANGQGTMPSMTDPANFGKTGTYDLTAPGAAPRPLAPTRRRPARSPFARYVA